MTAATLESTASRNAAATVGRSSTRTPTSVIVGRVITAIVVALLCFDASMKLFGVKEAIEGTTQLGYHASMLLPLGLIQLACIVLYLVPRTAPLGAILWTAYFGGAVATHVRLENPLFTHILSGVYVSAFLWLALYLRDARVRALFGPTR